MTNEELVKLIQEDMDNQEYWNILWQKTEDTVHYVYHKKVHRYYKENMNDDIIAILNVGWFNAVKTYKPEKATGPFHCYAIFIIDQQYRQFLRKMKPERIGKSVRTEFLNDIKLPTTFSEASNTVDFCITNILEDYESEDAFHDIETQDYISNKLERLKEALPQSYKYIIETIYNNKTQRQIAKMYNVSKHTVSRSIKRGYEWLKQDDELELLEQERLRKAYDK